jgi:hypothetical protein
MKPCQQLEIEDASPARLSIEEKKYEKNCEVPRAVLFVCLITLPLLAFLCGGSVNSTFVWQHNAQVSTVKGKCFMVL